jgi:hypothetical protein
MKARNSSSHGISRVEMKGEEPPTNLSHVESPLPSPLKEPARSSSTQNLTEVSAVDKSKPLQYALWGHYMGYGAATLCFWFGITAILWDNPHFYHCHVNGESISPTYIAVNGVCGAIYKGNYVCCDPAGHADIEGNTQLVHSISSTLSSCSVWKMMNGALDFGSQKTHSSFPIASLLSGSSTSSLL